MLSTNIESLINDHQYLESLKESDINGLIQQIKPLLSSKLDSCINSLCNKTVANKIGEGVAKRAYQQMLDDKIAQGVYVFLAHKHWQNNKNIINYLCKLINSTYMEFENDKHDHLYGSEYKCVSCGYYGQKNVVLSKLDNKHFLCNACQHELEHTQESKKHNFLKAFSYFSKKGVSCEHCKRFVPSSHYDETNVCPYPDCNKEIQNTKQTNFKKTRIKPSFVSDEYIYNNAATQDTSEVLDEDMFAAISDLIRECIVECIDGAVEERLNVVYRSFLKTFDDYSDAFCFYIINGKKSPIVPIQAHIYQKYCDIMLEKNVDKSLLFNGYRRFWGFVEKDNKIRYNTYEKFVNGEWIKDEDKNYIAYIDCIRTEDGDDITDSVKYYSFTNIFLNENIKPLTNCCIYYNSIYPSHTKSNMILIQRAKKQLANLVSKRVTVFTTEEEDA